MPLGRSAACCLSLFLRLAAQRILSAACRLALLAPNVNRALWRNSEFLLDKVKRAIIIPSHGSGLNKQDS
jgi:hypothetical protein